LTGQAVFRNTEPKSSAVVEIAEYSSSEDAARIANAGFSGALTRPKANIDRQAKELKDVSGLDDLENPLVLTTNFLTRKDGEQGSTVLTCCSKDRWVLACDLSRVGGPAEPIDAVTILRRQHEKIRNNQQA
jgi:hypothetical protein